VVYQLLVNGCAEDHRGVNYSVTPLSSSSEWKQFQKFYCQQGWRLNTSTYKSFLDLRNELYHALQGDSIDQKLDKQTEVLGSVTHPDHPSEFAVGQLRYIIQLAGLSSQVQHRVQHYETMVEAIKGSL
jgi:hypothetical protein